MAMIDREPDIMDLDPRWPDLGDVLRQGHFRFIYDALSDTMFIPFYEPIGPAVSVPVDLDQGDMDYVFLRVNVETQEVIGFQVEHFLSYAVGQMPDLINALDLAELQGMNAEQAVEIRCRVQPGIRERADAAAVIGELARLVA